jgi:transcriptional regulator with XRE-family HTH domain
METWADRLWHERKRLNLSQAEMAALGGLTKITVYYYEKAQRKPDIEYLLRISEAGVDIVYVLFGRRDEHATGVIDGLLPPRPRRSAKSANLVGRLRAWARKFNARNATKKIKSKREAI